MTAASPTFMPTAPPQTRRVGDFMVRTGEAFIIASREDDPDEGTFVYPRLWRSDDAVFVNWHFDRDMLDRILPTAPNGRVSFDGGRTWQRQKVFAPPGYKARTGPGEITSYWQCFETPGQPGRYRIATWRSSDNARSWGPMFWTPFDMPGTRGIDIYDPPEGYKLHTPDYKGGSQRPHPPDYLVKMYEQAGTRRRCGHLHTILPDGRGALLALTVTRWLPGGDSLSDDAYFDKLDWSRHAILQHSSRDGGRTWTFDGCVAFDARHHIGQFDPGNCFSEPAMAIYPDGHRVCVLRVGSFRWLHVVYSRDHGRTWSEPEPLAIRGVDPHLVAMPNGMLVLATGRPDLTIHFSLDRGRTWAHSETLFADDRKAGNATDRYTNSTSNPGLMLVDDHTLLYIHDVSRFDASQNDPWLKRAGFARVIGRLITVRRSVRATAAHLLEQCVAPLKRLAAPAPPRKAEPLIELATRPIDQLSLDGRLDDAFWKDLPEHALVDVQSGEAVSAATSFRAAWADNSLCLAVRCDEPDMARVRREAPTLDADSLWQGDTVEVLLRTPLHSYYQIVIGAAGLVVNVDRSNGIDLRWSSKAQVAASLDPTGWTLEVRLATAGDVVGTTAGIIGRPPTAEAPWFINVCRQRPLGDTMELSAFVPTGLAAFHQEPQWCKCCLSGGKGTGA